MFNPDLARPDFPILNRVINGKPLVYLDNAATSQKPQVVIDAISDYYTNHNANVHRGVHTLGDESTQAFHTARKTIAEFLGAQPPELVTVRNTTEAANQIAYTWGESVQTGDVLITTELEHHSNLVPWQLLAQRKHAELKFIPVDDQGRLDLEVATQLLDAPNVKLLTFSHISNTVGTLAPLAELVKVARQAQKRHGQDLAIFIDGAQAAPHLSVGFDQLDVDFYAVSAHKMLGPMGIGGLLVKRSRLEKLTPFLTGGGMIDTVEWQHTTFIEDLEERFTAGTPDVASLVGWAAACEYLKAKGMKQLLAHDQDLVRYALQKLATVPHLKIIGPTEFNNKEFDRVGSVAFVYQGIHAHDVGQVLDSEGVAVRSGHHCTMPLHQKFGWTASTRVSFQLYNTREDIDALVTAVQKVAKVFGS